MPYSTLPIVGAYHHPPAQTIINCLSIGTELLLVAEPENEYDPNAIAVYLESAKIPDVAYETLEEQLPYAGLSLQDLLNQDEWHLGYIPKEFAAQLKQTGTVRNGEPLTVTFAMSVKQKPRVKFSETVL